MPTASKLTQLQELGLVKAAQKLTSAMSLAEKCKVAYQHYRFITPEKIARFQDRLAKERKGRAYKTLVFTKLADYGDIPPDAALLALEEAKKLKCFDAFEIASVQWIEPVPDPLLLGRITGCEDWFFIAQWDEDVKIDDLLQPDEGIVKQGFSLT
jgi:hypothetical protein